MLALNLNFEIARTIITSLDPYKQFIFDLTSNSPYSQGSSEIHILSNILI